MAKAKIPVPIFICGVQRSGTTLLVEMLNHLEEVQLLPQETHVYPLFWHPLKGIVDLGTSKIWAQKLPGYFLQSNRGWTLPEGQQFLLQVTKKFNHLPAAHKNVNDLLESLFEIQAEQDQTSKYTGEKTPAHIYYLPLLLRKFGNAKILIANRDPRAIALSEIIKSKAVRYNAFNFAVRWASAYVLYQKKYRYLELQNQLLYIRYEDILHQPETIARSISSFLDVPYQESMLDMKVTNSSFGSGASGFDTSRIHRWKKDLPSNIIAEIDYYLAEYMPEAGYLRENIQNWRPNFQQRIKKIALGVILMICRMAPATFHFFNKKKSKYKL